MNEVFYYGNATNKIAAGYYYDDSFAGMEEQSTVYGVYCTSIEDTATEEQK